MGLDGGIIGIIGSFKSTIKLSGKVRNLNVREVEHAIKIVGLNESILDRDVEELSLSEKWKVELMTKLDNKEIIVGSLSDCLDYKDQEYAKKLLKKIHTNYGKRIIVIDNNVEVFFNLVTKVFIIKKGKVIYSTDNFFDDKLYEYANMPKIVDFIKSVNKDKKILNENIDIYELIKDIYRCVS